MRSWWDPSQEIINSNWLLSQVTVGPNFQFSPIEWDTWPRAGLATSSSPPIFTYSARRVHSQSSQPFIEWEPWSWSWLGCEECFMTVSGDQGGKQTITQTSPPALQTVITHLPHSSTILHFYQNLITPQFVSCCYHCASKGESVLGNPADKFTLKSLVCCQVFGLTKYTQKYEVVKIQKCFSG